MHTHMPANDNAHGGALLSIYSPLARAFMDGAGFDIAITADAASIDGAGRVLACAGLDPEGAYRSGVIACRIALLKRAVTGADTTMRTLLARGAEDLCEAIRAT